MAEQPAITYAAQITISLPGGDDQVTMQVMLWPKEALEIGGELKLLGDCTLADLEQYAQELQADVWDTYESIVLPELDADKKVEIKIQFSDGEDLDWQELVLLPPAQRDAVAQAVDKADEEQSEQSMAAGELDSDEGLAGSETAEESIEPSDDEAVEDAPDVAVSESELVFPEIEEEVEQDAQAAEIVPSQARVRVAGKRLPLNDKTWAAVDILIDEPALRASQAHAMSSLSREVAGVLVGSRPEKQPDGRYVVHIFDTIVARHTVMQGASVTYTPESWRYLNDTLAERYPDDTAVMVGWYHTHPGFGIFLSGMDLFIHQNFFTQIWHVAYVLDPRARSSGFFCWDRQKTRVERYDFAWPSWAKSSW